MSSSDVRVEKTVSAAASHPHAPSIAMSVGLAGTGSHAPPSCPVRA
jgi:hypothetical protein